MSPLTEVLNYGSACDYKLIIFLHLILLTWQQRSAQGKFEWHHHIDRRGKPHVWCEVGGSGIYTSRVTADVV